MASQNIINDDTSIHTEPGIHVALTHSPLSSDEAISFVKSPAAGAVVLFAGTTRNVFNDRRVLSLAYSSYQPRALRSMLAIARDLKSKHHLEAICMIHRLGDVPIGEESILIAVSTPHRKAAWLAGEEALELCKERVEVWKLERLAGTGHGGEDEDGQATYKANRDGKMGVRTD